MKTKTAKPVPAADREPTDKELLAIEHIKTAGDSPRIAEPAAIASASIDLARLGLNQIAYVRRAVVDEQPVWSIYSATGHPLGAAPTLEQAWGAIVQNDLRPVFVH